MSTRASYQQRDLGNPGIEYLKSSLQEGRSLSQQVARTIDLGNGSAVTYLPVPLVDLSAETFERGGVAGARVSEEIAEAFIRGQVSVPGDVLIGENPLAQCSDAWVRNRPLGVVCYLDEVYHLGIPDGMGVTSMSGALRAAHRMPNGQVSVVTKWNGDIPGLWPHTVSDLRPLAHSVRAILVSAFDGEAYVLWLPNQP